jgi:hypothetical protein
MRREAIKDAYFGGILKTRKENKIQKEITTIEELPRAQPLVKKLTKKEATSATQVTDAETRPREAKLMSALSFTNMNREMDKE